MLLLLRSRTRLNFPTISADPDIMATVALVAASLSKSLKDFGVNNIALPEPIWQLRAWAVLSGCIGIRSGLISSNVELDPCHTVV